MMMATCVFMPKPIKIFTVDRPFYYSICERDIQSFLFEGRVTEPSV